MPTPVTDILSKLGLSLDGHVQWGQRIPSQQPGIYFVSLSANPSLNLGLLEQAPVSQDAVEKWLADVPSLALCGVVQPHAKDVVDFLKGFWLPDENIPLHRQGHTSRQQDRAALPAPTRDAAPSCRRALAQDPLVP